MEYLKIADKYNFPVPRYTSYPTALQFKPSNIDDNNHALFLQKLDKTTPISIYLHIPFCEQLCWYCGCHTKITQREDLIERYVSTMCKELELVAQTTGMKLSVNHLHFGGGTPNILSVPLFEKLLSSIHDNFNVTDNAEIAAELDPRTLTTEMITCLADNKFNRLSFGVQDFDEDVQNAIHRVQPYNLVAKVVAQVREAGITGINFDLIYGLPKQTIKTMAETINKASTLLPDRLSVFGYAHVPWMKSHQRMIAKNPLPTPQERLEIFLYICGTLQNMDYQMIGIDHFAKTDDSLSIAYRNQELHRNFQGYTTDKAQNLIGIGASSISKFENGYIQNIVDIAEYQKSIKNNALPTGKYLELTTEDKRRADIIEQIMCYYKADIPTDIFKTIEAELKPYQDDNIINIDKNSRIEIINKKYAPIFARIVASCFDQYLKRSETRHAKAV